MARVNDPHLVGFDFELVAVAAAAVVVVVVVVVLDVVVAVDRLNDCVLQPRSQTTRKRKLIDFILFASLGLQVSALKYFSCHFCESRKMRIVFRFSGREKKFRRST